MGLKLYNEVIASGMESNPITHSALIYLCTRRKEFFPNALNFYRQMESLNFKIKLRVHNYMIQGCGKVADLKLTIEIWNKFLEL